MKNKTGLTLLAAAWAAGMGIAASQGAFTETPEVATPAPVAAPAPVAPVAPVVEVAPAANEAEEVKAAASARMAQSLLDRCDRDWLPSTCAQLRAELAAQ